MNFAIKAAAKVIAFFYPANLFCVFFMPFKTQPKLRPIKTQDNLLPTNLLMNAAPLKAAAKVKRFK